jgi:hypothetical protein
MILLHLPPVLRSLHEATGVAIWLSCFVLAYLARRARSGPRIEVAAVRAARDNRPISVATPAVDA